MHEYSITERLFHVAMDQAQLRDGERLHRLHIALDPQSGYLPDAIRFYFEQLARGSAAEGAELAFDLVEQPQHIRLTSLDVDDDHVIARRRICVDGAVQGVGFRPFVHNLAIELGLRGWVRNTSSGVEMELQGPLCELNHFRHHLEVDAPPLARILAITVESCPVLPESPPTVQILPSRLVDGRTLISPDVATCVHCLHELFDPLDRRYRYPFINCTHCGPRFTIIHDLPYDRPKTTMVNFPMCHRCTKEYGDTTDRRFHAQPVACDACGPAIWFVRNDESITGVDSALSAVATLLDQNGIVAIKGLGGFHLACRADSAVAVQRLRERKQRPAKPFAIMVRNVQEAATYCRLSATEEQLLLISEAPIVLLRKRDGEGARQMNLLSPALAPANGYIGVMLPYTPLHHLLLQAVSGPLVMTSGNRSGEPLCIDNVEAQEQLDFVDGFLLHNRPIARRCDDSVTFVAQIGDIDTGGLGPGKTGSEGTGSEGTGTGGADTGGTGTGGTDAVQMARRSRGFVPLPILLPSAVKLDRALLATGADLKNVSAVAVERQVFLSQYVGDLRGLRTRTEQIHALDDLAHLFQVAPQALVCDLHPDYVSSRYARQRAQVEALPLIEVQHHHAHIAACMAENRQTKPVIGLAFDGTGYGTDGCVWGGEAMVVDLWHFERSCHLEYLPLPGGDAAIQHPERIAYGYLRTLLPGLPTGRWLSGLAPAEKRVIDTMLERQINTPQTSSMGRLFDAVSALLGLCRHITYEAEAAIALEAAALQSDDNGPAFPFAIDGDSVRLASLFGAIIEALAAKTSIEDIARRFHRTVAELAVAMARMALQATTDSPTAVALSGGVWQNRLLLEMTVPRLRTAGFTVLLHHHVPANDGGIAYGQVAVAAARLAAKMNQLRKGELRTAS